MMRRFILSLSVLILLSAALVSAQTPTFMQIDWQPEKTTIKGTVEITGIVNPPGFQSYFLEAAYFALGEDVPVRWTPLSLPSITPVAGGKLGDWITTIFQDGIYQLRLHVVLISGESVYYTLAPIAVSNNGGALSSAPVTVIATPGAVILTAIPTNTPIPSPTPIPPTPAPNAPPIQTGGSVIGAGRMPLGGHVADFNARTQDAMRQAGMTWAKFQIRFHINDGVSLDYARDAIARGHDAGFKVLLGIVGEPAELRDNGEAYYAIFAEFLGKVAALNPDAIEVWNEMNIDREWPTGQIDPRRYADLLRPAYAAIKAANPNVTVITGALAPTGAEGAFGLARVWNDNRYYQVMATTDAAQHADCIGVHYNEGIVSPANTSGDPRDNYPTRYLGTMLDRVSSAFRGTTIPMCMTELGYLTPEGYAPLPSGFGWAGNVTIAQQAEWLRDAARILESYQSMPVRLMIVWNVDFTRYDTDPMAGYAIIRADGSCPACSSLAGR